jgi:hypothetical protein
MHLSGHSKCCFVEMLVSQLLSLSGEGFLTIASTMQSPLQQRILINHSAGQRPGNPVPQAQEEIQEGQVEAAAQGRRSTPFAML